MRTIITLIVNLVVFVILRYCILAFLFMEGYGSSGKKYINDEVIGFIVFALQMVLFYYVVRKWKNKKIIFFSIFSIMLIIYIIDLMGYLPFLRS